MAQKIHAIMIVEVAGRPPEYLINSLQMHVDKMKDISGVELVSSKLATPRKLDEEKDLYTMFAEVEVKTDSFAKLLDLVFEFMPSSIEVIDPLDIELNLQEATMFMNDLSGRLHKYDDLAKIAKFQIQELNQKLQQMQPRPKVTEVIQPLKVTMDSGNSSKDPNRTSSKTAPSLDSKKSKKKPKKK